MSAVGVVAYRVVDQVGDHALEQPWIARRRRWVERGVDVEAQAFDLGVLRFERAGCQDGEVGSLASLQPRLAAGEGEQ